MSAEQNAKQTRRVAGRQNIPRHFRNTAATTTTNTVVVVVVVQFTTARV